MSDDKFVPLLEREVSVHLSKDNCFYKKDILECLQELKRRINNYGIGKDFAIKISVKELNEIIEEVFG